MYYKKITDDIVFDSFGKKYVKWSEMDEKSVLNRLSIEQIDAVKSRRSKGSLNLIVTITSECDLECKYCFENHLERKAMSMRTCIELVDEIKGYIKNNDIRTIDCILFGGEPMLNKEVLMYFSGELSLYCKLEKIKLDMMMTTNGIICDQGFLIELAGKQVKSIQLSFDGTEKIHNRRRCAKDKACNPYRELMQNITILLKIFDTISVKYNFDQDNCNEYGIFLEELEKNVGDKKERITIVLETINKTPFGDYGNEYDITGKELAIQFVEMVKKTINMDFKYVTRIFVSPCMHTASNAYLIDTTGEAYSCISSYGIEEFRLGKFNRNMHEASARKRCNFTKLDLIKNLCKNCCYVPLCWGGCAYVLKSAGKNIYTDIQCRKTYFDTIIDAFYNEIVLKCEVDKIE